MNLRDEIKARMSQNREIVDLLSENELSFVREEMERMGKASGTYEIKLSRDDKNKTLSINLNYGVTYIR